MKETRNWGGNIKKVRTLKNIPQRYMAKELGMTQSAYSNIEKKSEGISEERLQKIAEIMGVTVDDIEQIEDRVTVHITTQTNTNGGNGFVHNNYANRTTDEILLQTVVSLAETAKALTELVATLKKA